MLVKTIEELQKLIRKAKKEGKEKIGFVPTMGYLHEGHLSLIENAKKENDLVIVSVFVNPTQFGPNEDFDNYPRNIDRDYKISIDSGADIVFAPESSEIYKDNDFTYVEVNGDLTNKLCGASRPGHFKGVTTVVCKLFNIVKPTNAYFGQKDAQQVAVIQKMVEDLYIDVNIIPCPIVREKDGLALSSRNVYLNENERNQALILSKSLFKAKDMFANGCRDVRTLKDLIVKNIKSQPLANIDYVEILDSKSFENIEFINKDVIIAIAVRFGKTRLIDNIYLKV